MYQDHLQHLQFCFILCCLSKVGGCIPSSHIWSPSWWWNKFGCGSRCSINCDFTCVSTTNSTSRCQRNTFLIVSRLWLWWMLTTHPHLICKVMMLDEFDPLIIVKILKKSSSWGNGDNHYFSGLRWVPRIKSNYHSSLKNDTDDIWYIKLMLA